MSRQGGGDLQAGQTHRESTGSPQAVPEATEASPLQPQPQALSHMESEVGAQREPRMSTATTNGPVKPSHVWRVC